MNAAEHAKQVVQIPTSPKDCSNWLNGQAATFSGKSLDVYSPHNGQKIGRVSLSSDAEVNAVVQSAQQAQLAWAEFPLKERCLLLLSLREVLLKRKEEISHVIAAESGKTYEEALAGLYKGIEVLEFAHSLQNLDQGAKMEVSRGVSCEVEREPLGVVAGISPFNFPAMVPMWMIPIAITLGNSFVWKPSEKTPLTSILMAKAFKEAGYPDGVLNVVQGDRCAVEAILDHPLVRAVGFVGSTPVAKQVYSRASANSKRVLALGGAKNHMILLPDADLQLAVPGITQSFTGCGGQRCMAGSVLLAVGDVDHCIEQIVAAASAIQLSSDMGAIITKESKQSLIDAIEIAEKDGAKLLLDGRKYAAPEGREEGYWLAPTILDGVATGSDSAQRELFGPVLSIIRCESLSQALEIESNSAFGNAASVFTQNGAAAQRVAQEAKAGMIGINVGVPVPREPFSFGGIGDSKFGQGDITGASSLDLWSNQKKITAKWSLQSDQSWMS